MKLALPPDNFLSEEHAYGVVLSSWRTSSENLSAWGGALVGYFQTRKRQLVTWVVTCDSVPSSSNCWSWSGGIFFSRIMSLGEQLFAVSGNRTASYTCPAHTSSFVIRPRELLSSLPGCILSTSCEWLTESGPGRANDRRMPFPSFEALTLSPSPHGLSTLKQEHLRKSSKTERWRTEQSWTVNKGGSSHPRPQAGKGGRSRPPHSAPDKHTRDLTEFTDQGRSGGWRARLQTPSAR